MLVLDEDQHELVTYVNHKFLAKLSKIASLTQTWLWHGINITYLGYWRENDNDIKTPKRNTYYDLRPGQTDSTSFNIVGCGQCHVNEMVKRLLQTSAVDALPRMLREEKYRSILPQDTFSICDFISGPIARKQVTLQTCKKITKNRKCVTRWELEIVRNRRKKRDVTCTRYWAKSQCAWQDAKWLSIHHLPRECVQP